MINSDTKKQILYYQVLQEIGRKGSKRNILPAISTGFKCLDDAMGGLVEGEIIVIGGRPGIGKTSLMISMVLNLLKNQAVPVAFFSLDNIDEEIMLRMISACSETSINDLLKGDLNNLDFGKIAQTSDFLAEAPFYVQNPNVQSISEIIFWAEQLVKEKNVKVIFIDSIQLISTNPNEFRNRDAEICFISSELKNFARKHHITIVISSQLSRQVERRAGSGNKPMLSDLRDSGSIEQDASKVLFVYRAEYYGLDFDEFGQDTKGRAEVKIAKNKFGDLKDVPLTFLGKYSKFVEIDKASFDYTNLRQNEFDDEPF